MANKKAIALLMDHMSRSAKTAPRSPRAGNQPHEPNPAVANFCLNYLDAFGYLREELAQWKDVSLGDIVDAVKQFQEMFGLKRTGQLCVRTVRAMEQPRCGCPDVVRPRHLAYRRVRAFVQANLPRWRKEALTYAVADYLPGVSKPDFEAVVASCFAAWTRLGNVEVQQVGGGQADILISNGRGAQSNFDGPGGVLAWAYMPDGSDQQLLMKFDLDEAWALGPAQRGILLPNVGCHEFGHLFGLDHSKLSSALMAPYYNAATAVPQTQDDIPRFQARYGVRGPGPSTPPAPAGVRVDVSGPAAVTVNGRQVA